MTVAVPSLLVVSESRITRRVVEMTFADQQVHVSVASSGEEALTAWRARPSGVVIADIAMDAPNGYAIAREVRAHPEGRRTAVILLAAQTDVVDEVAASRERVSAVLRKPLDSHQLIDAVRQAVRTGPPAPFARPNDGASPAVSTPDPAAPISPVAAATAGPEPVRRSTSIEDARMAAEDVALILGQDSSGLDDPLPVAAADVARQPVVEPELADTFHALLDGEQGTGPGLRPLPVTEPDVERVAARVLALWGAQPGRHERIEAAIVERVTAQAGAVASAAAERAVPAIATDVVERIARELVPRIAEEVARAIVTEVADRHVRDEIARLRAARAAG